VKQKLRRFAFAHRIVEKCEVFLQRYLFYPVNRQNYIG